MPPGLERPDFDLVGDALRYTWPLTGVQVEFSRFVDRQDGLYAEATFARVLAGKKPALLSDGRLNLMSSPARQSVLRDLQAQAQDVDWLNVLQQGCFLAKKRHREGDPPIDLMAMPQPDRPRWAVKPYIEYAGPTTLFGPGGSNKTYFADALAVSLATDTAIVGHPTSRTKTLILDYESDDATHYERVMAIQRGHDLPDNLDGWIFYRSMKVPLHAAAYGLRRFVSEKEIGCVVCDSLSLASGGELEAAAEILRCFAAARSLGVPFLFVSHVTKAALNGHGDGGRRRLSPFGSVYTENQSRNTWSVNRSGEEGEDEGYIALVHEKTNWRYHKRHGYRVTFQNDPADEDAVLSCEFREVNLADVPEFSDTIPLTERVLGALKDGSRTTSELRELMPEVEGGNLRATISNLKRKGRLVALRGDAYGLATDRDYGT